VSNVKAAVLHKFGAPLSVEQVPDLVIGTGEVLVDVVEAALGDTYCPPRWCRAPLRGRGSLFEEKFVDVGLWRQADASVSFFGGSELVRVRPE
jgi:hypothetical protein